MQVSTYLWYVGWCNGNSRCSLAPLTLWPIRFAYYCPILLSHSSYCTSLTVQFSLLFSYTVCTVLLFVQFYCTRVSLTPFCVLQWHEVICWPPGHHFLQACCLGYLVLNDDDDVMISITCLTSSSWVSWHNMLALRPSYCSSLTVPKSSSDCP